MLERATETQQPSLPLRPAITAGRFARDPAEFATSRTTPASPGTTPATGGTTTTATSGTSPTTQGTGPATSGTGQVRATGAVLTLIRGGEPVATFDTVDLTNA